MGWNALPPRPRERGAGFSTLPVVAVIGHAVGEEGVS